MIGNKSLMMHWYCKVTYNKTKTFVLKRLIIKYGGSNILSKSALFRQIFYIPSVMIPNIRLWHVA